MVGMLDTVVTVQDDADLELTDTQLSPQFLML